MKTHNSFPITLIPTIIIVIILSSVLWYLMVISNISINYGENEWESIKAGNYVMSGTVTNDSSFDVIAVVEYNTFDVQGAIVKTDELRLKVPKHDSANFNSEPASNESFVNDLIVGVDYNIKYILPDF